MKIEQLSLTSRRQFLKASATAAAWAAAPAILGTKSSAASPGDTLKIGLIGCGGRGSGAAGNALTADANAVVTAIGDLDEKKAQRCLKTLQTQEKVAERVNVDEKNVFVGLDAYKGVIE